MAREEFIKVLDKERYSYKIEGNKVIITLESRVYLKHLTFLPPGVVFRNGGKVYLNSLSSLPPGVVFENEGGVWLDSLISLPSGVVFKNDGDVYLRSLIGGWFDEWKGNIRDIDSNRLLNKMISLGLFEKKR